MFLFCRLPPLYLLCCRRLLLLPRAAARKILCSCVATINYHLHMQRRLSPYAVVLRLSPLLISCACKRIHTYVRSLTNPCDGTLGLHLTAPARALIAPSPQAHSDDQSACTPQNMDPVFTFLFCRSPPECRLLPQALLTAPRSGQKFSCAPAQPTEIICIYAQETLRIHSGVRLSSAHLSCAYVNIIIYAHRLAYAHRASDWHLATEARAKQCA